MPLRGGSKSIPDKNIKPIAGRPLFFWALNAAVLSKCFDAIYVASDSERIRKIVAAEFPDNVSVIDRSPESASDTASTEDIMLEFSEHVPFDVLGLIQATSPLTRTTDFVEAKKTFQHESLDSLLTAVHTKRFFWNNEASALNYTPSARPRRQDFEGSYLENGAFYFTAADVLSREKCRLGGRIGIHAMTQESVHELDEKSDWATIEHLLNQRILSAGLMDRLRRIKVLIADVDGTLTDGLMVYGSNGEILKNFYTRDGKGFDQLRGIGVQVCVITGEDSPTTAARMKKLRMDEYYPNVADKLALIKEKLVTWGVTLDQVAFIGDDLGDLEPIIHVGISFCPADAIEQIRAAADYICRGEGGAGAVREVCDLIFDAHVGTQRS